MGLSVGQDGSADKAGAEQASDAWWAGEERCSRPELLGRRAAKEILSEPWAAMLEGKVERRPSHQRFAKSHLLFYPWTSTREPRTAARLSVVSRGQASRDERALQCRN